jgi:hypothetical protein
MMDKKGIILVGLIVNCAFSSLAIFVLHDALHIISGVFTGALIAVWNLFLMEIVINATLRHKKPVLALTLQITRLLIYGAFAYLSYVFSIHFALGYGIGVASLGITLAIYFRKGNGNECK